MRAREVLSELMNELKDKRYLTMLPLLKLLRREMGKNLADSLGGRLIRALLLKYFDSISLLLFVLPLLTNVTIEDRLTLLKELRVTIAFLPVREEKGVDGEELALTMALVSSSPRIDITSLIEEALSEALTEIKSLALSSALSEKARSLLFRDVPELIAYLSGIIGRA